MCIPRGFAVLTVLLLPMSGWAQEAPTVPQAHAPASPSHPSESMTNAGSVVYTTGDHSEEPPSSVSEACDLCDGPSRHLLCKEVWGILEVPFFAGGSRMAPNGVPFNPLFGLNFDFNVGLLPNKKLYLFADNKFWAQRAAPGVTNSKQGQFDFSKREYDFDFGLAWNYWNNFELRVSAYALNNLNRGDSLSSPFGFKDGIAVENRYYFGNADIYDVGRLSFVSLGYLPSKSLVGGDGTEFHPGLAARAYLTYDLPAIWSYAYFDGQFNSERVAKPRLLEMDTGLAIRPFRPHEHLEFRLGIDVTGDVQADTARTLIYGAIRLAF